MNFSEENIKKLESFLGVQKRDSKVNNKYILKTQKYCSIFRFIPGVLMIGVGNSVAMNAGSKDSDIDLFVVTKKNSIWFVRIIMTFILQILGERKTDKKHAGKFCLSFFSTEDALNFSNFIIKDDIYLFYWILTMKPILVKGKIYERFIQENTWANFGDYSEYSKTCQNSLIYNLPETFSASFLLKSMNSICKRLFLRKTLNHFYRLGKPFGVIISDNMLKFHDKDQRKNISNEVLGRTTGKKIKVL